MAGEVGQRREPGEAPCHEPATDPEWTGAGTSAARATVVGTSPFFATRLRISAGDGIGVDDSTSGQFFGGAGTGVGVLWRPQLGDGVTRSPTVAGGVPLVQAQVEADSDRDGFGDESQDDCPGEAGGSNGCETTPPETIITERPQSKVEDAEEEKEGEIQVRLVGAGAVFRCDTDEDLPTACRSPTRAGSAWQARIRGGGDRRRRERRPDTGDGGVQGEAHAPAPLTPPVAVCAVGG